MKKTLLSLLTTVAFITPTFATDDTTTQSAYHATPSIPTASNNLHCAFIELDAFDRRSTISDQDRQYSYRLGKALVDTQVPQKRLSSSYWMVASFAAQNCLFHTLKALAKNGVALVLSEKHLSSPLLIIVNHIPLNQFKELCALTQKQRYNINAYCSYETLLHAAVNNNGAYQLETLHWLLANGARTGRPEIFSEKTGFH
jgi:hypothetical protein